MSYPILDFLDWILFDHVGHAFMSYCRTEYFRGYQYKRTSMIKSARAPKSQITVLELMNCIPLIIGVHLYL